VDGLEIPTPSPDPSGFVTRVDNRWFPLEPGTVWTYRTSTGRTEVVTVTGTKQVQGVTTTVVRDVVAGDDGRVVSESFAWYAQDTAGNVWRFGQEQARGGSGDDSWEAGVDGAEAGLVMAAHPRLGDGYSQGDAPGVSEDRTRVLTVDGQHTVPLGEYDDVVATETTSPLESGVVVRAYYAPGIGLIDRETVQRRSESTQLLRLSRG
jgi:hypothetical protein